MVDNRRNVNMDVSKNDARSNKNTSDIRKEIETMTNRGKLTQADIAKLYSKYPDKESIIKEMIRSSTKRYTEIKDQARKVAARIYNKYSNGSKPLHEILQKMMKYKAKHKWSDYEYDEFRKELTSLLTGNRAKEIDNNQNIDINRSIINKTLGNETIRYETERGLAIKESEYGILSEILSLHETSSALHKQVFMQSLLYTDCSLVAMTGEFKRERNMASNYIHPLIACMFLPKFDLFEMLMLYSNFGSIIKSRYEKKPIVTEPDSLLFNEITSDPNDVVCDINSPIADLRNRYKVQISLWKLVLALRNGNYYETEPISEFMTTLNTCRNNLYDNADLAFNQDEGSMLRRLFSVFSMRPTIVYTKPISNLSVANYYGYQSQYNAPSNYPNNYYGQAPNIPVNDNYLNFNPYGLAKQSDLLPGYSNSTNSIDYFNNQPSSTITNIPVITIQLPPFAEGVQPIDLRSATSQTIWINENKTIVPKEQSIIHSKEVLIFYANRRLQKIQIKTYLNPLPFSQLPLTMSNFEKLNPYPIDVPSTISIGRAEETYQLRSVVAVNQTQIKQGNTLSNIISGSTGLITTPRNFEKANYDTHYYLYDPFGASLPVIHPTDTKEGPKYFTNKPISIIEPNFVSSNDASGSNSASFFERATHTGTIFIYAKSSGYNPREPIPIY